MKFLKKFETHNDEITFENLHVGDIVLIKCKDLDINNQVFIISEIDKNYDGFTIFAYKFEDNNFSTRFYDHEIVKKLTPEEVEYFTNVNKYNL